MSRAAGMFFVLFSFSFITLMFILGPLTMSKRRSSSRRGSRRGLSRATGMFFFVFFIYYVHVNFLLIYVRQQQHQHQRQWQNSSSSSSRGLEVRHVSSCWYVFLSFFFFFFYYTNVYLRSAQHVETVMEAAAAEARDAARLEPLFFFFLSLFNVNFLFFINLRFYL
jgi:hypothetical protein